LRHSQAILLALSFLLATTDAIGDSYRCGRKVIRTGDPVSAVLRSCGEPSHKARGRETLRLNGTQKEVAVEHWYYRNGRRSLERAVAIYRGRVVSIAVVGR